MNMFLIYYSILSNPTDCKYNDFYANSIYYIAVSFGVTRDIEKIDFMMKLWNICYYNRCKQVSANANEHIFQSKLNRFFAAALRLLNQSAVWPDLAKFRQFGNILQVFGQFLKA